MSGDRTRRCRPRPNSVSALCFLAAGTIPLARRRASSTSRVLPRAVVVRQQRQAVQRLRCSAAATWNSSCGGAQRPAPTFQEFRRMRTPMAKAVGVDLSTTNSVIAAWQGGEAAVIPASAGSLITPSVAVFTDTGEPLVGQLARRQAIPNPKGTVYSAECSTGRCFDEVPDEAKADGFDTVPDEHGKARSARRRTSARWCCESSPTTWATRDGGDHHRDHPFQRRPTRGAPRTPDAWRASTCCAYQRADRARTRLRCGQEAARDRARLRPGRRYLRRRRWRA